MIIYRTALPFSFLVAVIVLVVFSLAVVILSV
jgi:hypothetical protein